MSSPSFCGDRRCFDPAHARPGDVVRHRPEPPLPAALAPVLSRLTRRGFVLAVLVQSRRGKKAPTRNETPLDNPGLLLRRPAAAMTGPVRTSTRRNSRVIINVTAVIEEKHQSYGYSLAGSLYILAFSGQSCGIGSSLGGGFDSIARGSGSSPAHVGTSRKSRGRRAREPHFCAISRAAIKYSTYRGSTSACRASKARSATASKKADPT
jgi:hypothetical protein